MKITRCEFVLLFDVKDGNPNGDPDAGNLPRVDPETGHGLVTDVCLKRKVRNYVLLTKENKPPFEIYIKERAILNEQHERAYESLGLVGVAEGKRKNSDNVADARMWMCKNFFDVRTFGAVMSTGISKCGQVRGPIQMTFARSIDPVVSLEHTITRMAVTTKEEAVKQDGDNRTMGRKSTIPYGLYKCYGFLSANLAEQTRFSEDDLTLFWDALLNMFDHDRSASRGLMETRALFVFSHDNQLGRAPAHRLLERVHITKKDPGVIARSVHDYNICVDDSKMPEGVSVSNKVEHQLVAR